MGWLLFLLCSFICFDSYVAHAQQAAPGAATADAGGRSGSHHVLGLSFGHSILFGTWSEPFDNNFSFAAHYTYEATPIFGFLAMLGLSNHPGVTDNEGLSIISLEPDVKVNLLYFDNVVLHSFGGFGLYKVGQKTGGGDGSVLAFGMNLGFGVDLRLGEHFVFGPGIQFRSVFAKRDNDVRTTNYPIGMEIGGEMLRLFVQAGYVF